MIVLVARRMAPGGHLQEHIEAVKWRRPSTNEEGVATRAQIVAFLESGYTARALEPSVEVVIMRRDGRAWIEAKPGAASRDLLALPVY